MDSIAFCRAYTWVSLNGNVSRLIHQIEEATTVDELTLIQSKMMVLAGGHSLLREENASYLAQAVSKSKSSGRGGGIAVGGGSSASGSSQAATFGEAAPASVSGQAATLGEAAPASVSSQAATLGEADPASGSSQAAPSGEAEPVGAYASIAAKPSSKPYYRLLQQTGKARAIAKSGKLQPQNKALARPTVDCLKDLQARRAKSKPPAVPPKARPSQPKTPQKAGAMHPKTPPKAKQRPKQPSEPPPKHLLAASSVAVTLDDDDSSDDWGHWTSAGIVGAGSVDAGSVGADSVGADSVAADSVAADHVDADHVDADTVDADTVDADHVDADDVVATCRVWADDELNAGILQALQELAEAKKTDIIANNKSVGERPKWWKKRGTSTRGGSYGTYDLYIGLLASNLYVWRHMPQVGQCPGLVLDMPLKPLYELSNLQETIQGNRPL